MKLKKVINLFGGPGVGKTLIATGLFHNMKVQGLSVEYVGEYAKELTYENRQNVLRGDQLYIFAKQHRKVLRLRDVVDYIILDSPLLLSTVYYDFNSGDLYHRGHFRNLVTSTFNNYPNLNIFLIRNPEYNFETHGRTQDENESDGISTRVLNMLHDHYEYFKMMSDDQTINNILAQLELS